MLKKQKNPIFNNVFCLNRKKSTNKIKSPKKIIKSKFFPLAQRRIRPPLDLDKNTNSHLFYFIIEIIFIRKK